MPPGCCRPPPCVAPVDEVVSNDVEDPFAAPAFARFLRDQNQEPYALGLQARGLSEDAVIYRPSPSPIAQDHPPRPKQHATLGEVLPVPAPQQPEVRVVTQRQQVQPATGRLLDAYL